LVNVAATAAALAFAVNAEASSKQLSYNQRVDQIASNIAGTSVQVLGEDDWNEGASFLPGEDPGAVLWFTYPFALEVPGCARPRVRRAADRYQHHARAVAACASDLISLTHEIVVALHFANDQNPCLSWAFITAGQGLDPDYLIQGRL
jgi:hypothetical protein